MRIRWSDWKPYGDKADEKASELAHHLGQAGVAVDPSLAIRYLERAGDKALASAAAEESFYFFDTAISLDVEDKKQRADLLFKRGTWPRSYSVSRVREGRIPS